jgi:hypothetical protein
MKLLSPLELIRENRDMYLGKEEPCGRVLAVRLADCALISGARRVELLALSEEWMAVSSDTNWIIPAVNNRQKDGSFERAFTAMIPLRGGQQNEIRFEVVVAAFSKDLSIKSGARWLTLEGEAPPQEICDSVKRHEFSVVFRTNRNTVAM